jgi:hypothetical protein
MVGAAASCRIRKARSWKAGRTAGIQKMAIGIGRLPTLQSIRE